MFERFGFIVTACERAVVAEKKILLLISFLEPWSMGPERGAPSLYETIRGYASAGWHVHYLTAQKRSVGGGSHEQNIDIKIPDVSVHRFPLPAPFTKLGLRIQGKLDRLYYFPSYAAKAIQEYLERVNPTLIYAYEEGAILAMSRLKSNSICCPVLHRFQGTILGSSYRSFPAIMRKMETWMALRKQADLYVMTDDGTLGDQALTYWNSHVTKDNLLFIRNGIDSTGKGEKVDHTSTLERFSEAGDAPILLMVSRLAGWKRIDRGIDLVSDLRGRYSSTKLIVVGDGEQKDQLMGYAAAKGVKDNVFFAGSQPRSTVFSLMQSCDIFLSLYDISNCGNPLFEALLSGIPVITLNNGSTSAVVTDRINGLLVEPNDQFGLFSAMLELYENESLRRKISEGGLAWARQNMLSWNDRMEVELSWIYSHVQLRE